MPKRQEAVDSSGAEFLFTMLPARWTCDDKMKKKTIRPDWRFEVNEDTQDADKKFNFAGRAVCRDFHTHHAHTQPSRVGGSV